MANVSQMMQNKQSHFWHKDKILQLSDFEWLNFKQSKHREKKKETIEMYIYIYIYINMKL